MNYIELLILAIGLAMDSFAVSICKGLSMKKLNKKSAFIIALYFGFFHFIFPVLGYFLGVAFSSIVEKADHWIAFVLLGIVGAKMIMESFEEESNINDSVDFKTMLLLSIATGIDAFAIGVSFAFINVNIWLSSSIIFIVVYLFSVLGVYLGNKFGNKFGNKAELFGGVILILMGIKILLEHLGII